MSQLLDLLHQRVHQPLLGNLVQNLPLAEQQPLALAPGDADVGGGGLPGAVDGAAHNGDLHVLLAVPQRLLHLPGDAEEVHLAAAAGGAGDKPGALAEAQPPEDIPGVKDFLDRYAARWSKGAVTFQEDISKTHEVLDNYQTYDLLGGVLLVENQIVGFSLGEIIGDTLFTHIEKADRDYEGCYQMLVAQFAQQFAQEGTVAFINREDDTGDPGLRTSKLSYHPVALLEKYTVTVDEPCNYCKI